MRKILLFIYSTFIISSALGQTWVQKNNFPGVERYAATGFTIKDKLYMGTGYNGVTMMNDWWEFDPATDQWTQKASFPGAARFAASSFTINNKGYIFFGSTTYPNYTFPTDVWEYDPVINQWTQKATFPGQGRYTAVSVEINGKGYAGTGWRSGTFYNDWWEYNPIVNGWSQKANFAGGLRQAAMGFSILNKGYVGLGETSGNFYNDLWEYDPAFNNWIQRTNFPGQSRSATSTLVIGNQGYTGSGQAGNLLFTDFFKYDPTTNAWYNVPGFSPGRIVAVAVSTIDCGYIITGKSNSGASAPTPSNTLNDFWEFCLPTNINENPTFLQNFSILPNPLSNQSYLKFNLSENAQIKVELFNYLGEIVSSIFAGSVEKNKDYSFKITKNSISNGLYFIKVSDEKGNFNTLKLLIY